MGWNNFKTHRLIKKFKHVVLKKSGQQLSKVGKIVKKNNKQDKGTQFTILIFLVLDAQESFCQSPVHFK